MIFAGMAELADAQDLGSCEEIRMGSTPITRTTKNRKQTSMYVRLLSVF